MKLRRRTIAIALLGAAACNGSSPSPSASASATASPSGAAATAAPSASGADPDATALAGFFDTMHDRLLARIQAMHDKKYASQVGIATDLAMLTPEAMLADARTHADAYGSFAASASHVLASRPDLREKEVERYMRSIDKPVRELGEDLKTRSNDLPKANVDDCLDALRILADDHSLGGVLAPVLADCAGTAKESDLRCAQEATSRADFDKCRANPPPGPSASASARPAVKR